MKKLLSGTLYYAMLDQLEAKAAALYNKHFGSPEKAAEAARKRGELREVISMRLVTARPISSTSVRRRRQRRPPRNEASCSK